MWVFRQPGVRSLSLDHDAFCGSVCTLNGGKRLNFARHTAVRQPPLQLGSSLGLLGEPERDRGARVTQPSSDVCRLVEDRLVATLQLVVSIILFGFGVVTLALLRSTHLLRAHLELAGPQPIRGLPLGALVTRVVQERTSSMVVTAANCPSTPQVLDWIASRHSRTGAAPLVLVVVPSFGLVSGDASPVGDDSPTTIPALSLGDAVRDRILATHQDGDAIKYADALRATAGPIIFHLRDGIVVAKGFLRPQRRDGPELNGGPERLAITTGEDLE